MYVGIGTFEFRICILKYKIFFFSNPYMIYCYKYTGWPNRRCFPVNGVLHFTKFEKMF